jgi:two-component system NtrC family sensor kinase
MGRRIRLAEAILFLSFPLIFILLILTRPPLPFLVLLLAPIALAAVLYEFVGGTLAALAAMIGVALLVALDPDTYRRASMLQEVWPILVAYLVAGPFVGWLVSRERESAHQLELTARRLHIVQEIVQAINTSLDPEDTLQIIIAEIQRLVPFQRAAIFMIGGNRLQVVATSDDEYSRANILDQSFTLNQTAASIAIQGSQIWTGSSAVANDYPDTRLLDLSRHHTCAIIPLRFQQEAIGVFTLAGENLDNLAPETMEDLSQVVDQIAIAIEHARLYKLERERAKALAAISEAGREIASSLDLDRTLQLVMLKAAETLPMDAGALFVFDDVSQLYRVAVSHNLPPDQVDKITFGFDEGVPGWVVHHRRPLIIDDALLDDRVHPNVVEVGIRSVLAIPLITRQRTVGVLNLFCQTETNAFDEEALRLAQVYANQAAVFIENARLVDELRQAAAELEARVEKRTKELRETQEQVIRAEKMAAVGRLAASVAHEVNNPLQAITLHLQLMADDDRYQAGQEELVIVQQEVDRIAVIVQRLLEFQRPKHGRRTLQTVSHLLDDVLALAGKQLQHSKIAVSREDTVGLEPIMVAGDQLKQVFLNLVLNALEAMPDGGELTIRSRPIDEQLEISFTDTGAGIEPEELSQIFEPFFSTKHTGSGLGLAVSQEIVADHGGSLEVLSQPGRGSTFLVLLPVYQEAEAVNVV